MDLVYSVYTILISSRLRLRFLPLTSRYSHSYSDSERVALDRKLERFLHRFDRERGIWSSPENQQNQSLRVC
jgi:hypothetical protein